MSEAPTPPAAPTPPEPQSLDECDCEKCQEFRRVFGGSDDPHQEQK